jgi:hypothetical protein
VRPTRHPQSQVTVAWTPLPGGGLRAPIGGLSPSGSNPARSCPRPPRRPSPGAGCGSPRGPSGAGGSPRCRLAPPGRGAGGPGGVMRH